MILLIPLNDLFENYRHIEPHLHENKTSLKEFAEASVAILDKVELADSRNYSSNPEYYLDYTNPLAEFEQKIQGANPTNCYEDMNAALVHHQLTALALEVYYELVNSLAVYKIVDHPALFRAVVGWRGQNMLLKVYRRF